MLHSMTGFGKAEKMVGNKKFNIELRSVNSKQFDLNLRMPSVYKEKEIALRNKLSKKLLRGKMDLAIYYDLNEESAKHKVNKDIVKDYYLQLKEVQNELSLSESDLLANVLRMPDVMMSERAEFDPEEWSSVDALIDEALTNFQEFRLQEGDVLKADFIERIETIRSLTIKVTPFEIERTQAVRDRVQKHLSEFETDQVDNNRFEQEMIYYLEKLDITEERVRLENHLNYFIETLNQEDSQGKKLGFICQEIGREVNTMGSKANHAEIQKLVVEMKDELEKIKEQVLNVL